MIATDNYGTLLKVTKKAAEENMQNGRQYVIANFRTGEVFGFSKSWESAKRKAAKTSYLCQVFDLKIGSFKLV